MQQQQQQQQQQQPEVRALLLRHKASLLRELEASELLSVLLKRGVITDSERQRLASSHDVQLFVELLQAKGFEAFREFCFALEAECPHVLTDLLVDQHAITESEKHEQHQQLQQQPNQQQDPNEIDLKHCSLAEEEKEELVDEDDDDEPKKDAKQAPPPPPPQPPPSADNSAAEHQQVLEVLDEPVDEPPVSGGERGWEVHQVTVTRVPGYGFGIAVSGGRDNPHFSNGDPAIAISDVLKAGPAEGKLQVNDRIISANGVSLEGADYGAAVRVLRDSGSTVLLVVKRRAAAAEPSPPGPLSPLSPPAGGPGQQQAGGLPAGAAPAPAPAQSHRLSLSRPSKKEDFGIVLGCRLYVREVTRDGTGARPGDLVERIAGLQADNMSLKEARKLMEQSKERLSLVVSREAAAVLLPGLPDSPSSAGYAGCGKAPPGHLRQPTLGGAGAASQQQQQQQSAYASQNLYVPPPTRLQAPPPPPALEDKSNLAPRGRSRGPLLDVSLSQLDLPATPTQEPPRPPPPRPEDYYGSRRQIYEDEANTRSLAKQQPMPDPRFITFQKEGSVGVRLTGGNETGVFVNAVQPGSPASLQGLQPGDKILKVNDMDMKGVTREEAVLFLLSLQEQIDLIVQHRRHEYEQIVASGKGDSFHIKTHFHYEQPDKGEMSFRSGDVFHVIDTLHNGVVGSWQVYRIGRNNQEVQRGIIPNKARAEELATAQFNATKKELSASESRGSFFRRRRGSHRRSKSLGRDHWDDVVFSDSVSKFPAYERVVLRHPGFIRPVVLFGPVADLAREKLLKDFPDKFTAPQSESQTEEGQTGKSAKPSGIIRLSAIREVMERGKHALLDITPNAVDRLNYAQFYPIVIFLKAENKQIIKEMRAGIPKSAHKSSKKLLEQCQKLDKIWGHVFSAVITLTSPESWYRKLRELIDWQQQSPLWMSQTKPEEALSDDFLFPMTSRLSYASSPESDLELSPAPSLPGTLGVPSRLKSSSDPSIATQDDAVAPPPYTTSGYQHSVAQLLHSVGDPGRTAIQFSPPEQLIAQHAQHRRSRSHHQQQQQQQQQQYIQQQQQLHQHSQHQPQQMGPPDLPPRLDRSSKPTSTLSRIPFQPRSALNKTDSVLDVGNYINAAPHRSGAAPPPSTAATAANSSLERNQAKAGSYDSMSSYDSYNTNGGNLPGTYAAGPTTVATATAVNSSNNRLGPNVPDDLKSSSMGMLSRPHDPYKFTRSTAIPVQETQTRTDYAKYSRAGDYKPVVPPPQPSGKSTGTYKPVPPPKPKNYRPPQQPIIQDENNSSNVYQHSKSYSVGSPHMLNGAENGVNAQRNSNSQYYYNISPANRNLANDAYTVNSNQVHNHMSSSPASHNHSMSHSHPMSSSSMLSHSHSSSPGQIGLAHSHSRVNGHSHSNSHSGVTLHNSSIVSQNNHSNSNNNASNGNGTSGIHNRESSALDLASSREQRGSAFELYRKPLHHHNIRAMGMARGVFGNDGGVLEGPGGVSLIIPPGALPPNNQREIYFSVTDPNGIQLHNNTRGHRSSISPPMNNGESMLSPLVECGPKGLEFQIPVELRIPHQATPAHRLALKATDTEDNSSADWLNVKLPDPTSDHVIVRLDHF